MVAPDEVRLVVTSWSEKGEAQYGGRFREGFARHWARPFAIPFEVVTDRMLESDPGIRMFLKGLEANGVTGNRDDIHHGAAKWCRKVLALTSRDLTAIDGWMLWIDGDVEFTAPPSEEFFEAVCPGGKDVSYLGRPWAYASETGFVAYNMRRTHTRMLLSMMRDCYLTGHFRRLREWGDAGVFDWCRSVIGRFGLCENDLSGHLEPSEVEQNGLHVWPSTVLATAMTHHKGPKRREAAYATPRR